MDDTILGNAVGDDNASEAVDSDFNQASIAADVHPEICIFQQSWEIKVDDALRYVCVDILVRLIFSILALLRLVNCVAVDSGSLNNMISEEWLKVFQAILAEQESVDAWSEFLEGPVVWREQGSAIMVGGVEFLEKASLTKAKLQCAEFSWQ